MVTLLVEEHKILMESLTSILLEAYPSMSITPSSNGKSTLNTIQYEANFDLLIIDLQLSDINGIELVEILSNRLNETPIIVMNNLFSSFLIKKLLKFNVKGFLNQYNSSKDLVAAIDAIRSDNRYYSEDIKTLIDDFNFENEYIHKLKIEFISQIGFTERELEIIALMVTSKTNKEIADLLFLSNDTIKFHRKNIYRKSGVGNLLDLYKLLNLNHFFYEPN